MKTPILLIAACCLLSACAAGIQPTTVEPIAVPPPANLLMAPLPLPPAPSGQMPDLEANHRAVAKAYHQLAAQMCSLLAFLQIDTGQDCTPWMKSF